MNNLLMMGLGNPPKGKRSLAAQLSFCFVVTLVILFVVSSIITTVYVSVLKKERAEAIKAVALSTGLNLSGTTITEGLIYPLPAYEYERDRPYTINIYLRAGNSFIRVYTSAEIDESIESTDQQYTLDNDDPKYKKAFDQMTVELSVRIEDKVTYRTAVAPIIGSSGAASGIIEVMMKETDFGGTVNGFSLSWVFTIISIALSITIVYYQTHKMLVTVFAEPNRQLPKVIRYGLSGYQAIAFFSAMGCVIPPLVISQFLKNAEFFSEYKPYVVQAFIVLSVALYAVGFFGFRSWRIAIFNRLTVRVALVASVALSFVVLVVNGILSHPIAYILLQLPIAFGLGMLFFFQREYRIYAGRLGHEGFDEITIHKTQFSSQVMGAAVGSVLAGIVFDRFGLLAVLIISGVILFVVTIMAMLFVQHCPASNEPSLHLATFIYALTNRKSGSFLLSGVVSAGMQLAFLIGFLPDYLGTVGISIATVSFYYMLFAFSCFIAIKVLLSIARIKPNVVSSLWISGLLQIIGYAGFAIFPTAKMAVVSVTLFGLAMGLHGFRYAEYYGTLIRQEKRSIAGIILERSFANGVILGAVLLSASLMVPNLRISLIVYCFICAAILLSYPIMSLIHIPARSVDRPLEGDPFSESDEEWAQTESDSQEYETSDESGDYYEFYRQRDHQVPWPDENDIVEYDPYVDYPDEEGDKWV